jgi:cobalt-precorrin 5A hydrolase
MIIAGIGCRRLCTADDILAAIRLAERTSNTTADALAAPDFKRGEPGLLAAAARLGLPLHWIGPDAMAYAQPACVTRSMVALAATGHASIAEAAAIAASNGRLILPRVATGGATCAIAGP